MSRPDPGWLDGLRSTLARLQAAHAAIDGWFEAATPATEATFGAWRGLLDGIDLLPEEVAGRSLPGRLSELGLEGFAERLQGADLVAGDFAAVFEKSFLAGWLDAALRSVPALRDLQGEEGRVLRAAFCREEEAVVRESGPRLARRLARRLPHPVSPIPGSEVETLHRQALARARHKPLRQLFAEIPHLLPRLKPCLLMSPMTVSTFLAGTALRFDLVIFDEASQIPLEDAVASVWRGEQLIVAGDDQQLPPTTFFQAGTEAPAGVAAVPAPGHDADPPASVLDEARRVLPTLGLRWHYRSRDEGLIAFSNRHFYRDELLTFPSPRPRDPARGVSFRHVPDGVYDRGKTRVNRREAEVVAELLFAQLKKRPGQSVGVIAFSQAQMTAIESQLDRRRRADARFENHFRDDRPEPVFVRNLETVQGDERDVVFLSIGYGPDSTGRLARNFGPLNRPGGEKRLNVAATRARDRLVVVGSFHAADLMLKHSAEPGVRALRDYLDFAENGHLAARPDGADNAAISDPLLDSIAAAVAGMGYEARPPSRFGTSPLDLAVIDPRKPDRWLVGIRTDGPRYRATLTARDRDRLVPQVLAGIGWPLLFVRALDWWRERGPHPGRTPGAAGTGPRAAPREEAEAGGGRHPRRRRPDRSRSTARDDGPARCRPLPGRRMAGDRRRPGARPGRPASGAGRTAPARSGRPPGKPDPPRTAAEAFLAGVEGGQGAREAATAVGTLAGDPGGPARHRAAWRLLPPPPDPAGTPRAGAGRPQDAAAGPAGRPGGVRPGHARPGGPRARHRPRSPAPPNGQSLRPALAGATEAGPGRPPRRAGGRGFGRQAG